MSDSVITPRAIPAGGVIGAFSPSDPVVGDRRQRVALGVELLRHAGLQVEFARHALSADSDNTNVSPSARAMDIMQLITDDRIAGLIATCGGKSSNAVLRFLDYEGIRTTAKPVVGFSDVGVVLNAITARTGLKTFYGPNVLSKLDETRHHTLLEFREELVGPTYRADFAQAFVPGRTVGRIIGGNLSTFTVSVAGTEYEPRFEQTILMWEAGSDDLRLVDQYLEALELRGVIDRLNGMLIGRVGGGSELPPTAQAVLKKLLRRYSFPVLWMPIFGHGDLENPIWPIGGMVELDATRQTVTILEPFVRPI